MILDRRRFLVSGAVGASMLALPAWAQFGRGFTHGVASGEPSQHSVLLWTRFVSESGTRLVAEVSETADFTRIITGGNVTADPARDGTAKLVVDGLSPDRWYHYRFVAPDGTKSPVGRTRTLPDDNCASFDLGVFSCSNLPFGWFNAYAHAAARRDLDLMLHLGDYIYEYPRGKYPGAADSIAGRVIEPAGEIVHLADYRLRHASYRADRDLQALHAACPMVVMWDDHETANDSSRDGAENHDPATEGDWAARKRAAMRAYHEWMPISDADWAEYRIGDLATIFRPETRLTARTRQASFAEALAGGADPVAALTRFRDDVWQDPSHRLMGADQEAWLFGGLKRAAKTTRWQILAQQVNMGYEMMPTEAANWLKPDAPKQLGDGIQIGLLATKLGMPHNMDSWNGYPLARSRLLRAALDAEAEFVVLSGDSHNGWAYDLNEAGTPAGVEFGGHSVTSPGYESYFPGIAPADIAKALRGSSPELRWADTAQRGYMTVSIRPDDISTDWLFLSTIREKSMRMSGTHRERLHRGARKLS
ncbi:MAG TPA: alkaline phosphatase D family protein [Sphingobium sp.]